MWSQHPVSQTRLTIACNCIKRYFNNLVLQCTIQRSMASSPVVPDPLVDSFAGVSVGDCRQWSPKLLYVRTQDNVIISYSPFFWFRICCVSQCIIRIIFKCHTSWWTPFGMFFTKTLLNVSVINDYRLF